MDVGRKDVVMKWINCLHIGPEIDDLQELHNGRHFIGLLKIMKTESEKGKFLLKNWTRIVKHFLEEHYDVGLQDELDFAAAEKKNEFELAKISVLLLCASIHCDGKEQFIKSMCTLDCTIQEIIKSIIEGVLSSSGTALCHDFAKVLKEADFECAIVPSIRIQQENRMTVDKQKDCMIYCNDGEDVNSPIKQCFQSPQVASWAALKEKEMEINKLKGNLETELTSRSYLEIDLQDMKKENQKLLTCIEMLKETIRNLTEKCDNLSECQNLLANKELAFQKLQTKCEEQTRMVSDYPSLELAFKNLNLDNQSLEESLDRLQKRLDASEARVKELGNLEESLAELKEVLVSKDGELRCITATAKDQENELTEMRQTNKNLTKLLEDKSEQKDFASGENMTVISNIIALENDIKRLHEEALVKEKQIEKLMKTHLDEKSKLEHELKNANLNAERAEADMRVFKEDVKLLRKDISKLDGKLVSVQEQRLKERRELKALIKQQTEDIEFLQNESKEMCTKLSDLEMRLTTRKDELDICRTELENKARCITQLEEEKAGLFSDHGSLLKEKEALSLDINCCRDDVRRIGVMLQEKCDESASLTDRLESQTEELENHRQQLVKVKVLIEELETHKAAMNAKYDILIAEKDVLETDLCSCRSEIEVLSANFQEKCLESASLTSSLAALKLDLENYQTDLEDRNTRISLLEDQKKEIIVEHGKLVEANGLLSLQMQNCQETIDQLDASLQEKHSVITNFQLNIHNLEEKLDSCVEDLNVKATRILQLEELNTEMDANYETIKKEKDALEAELCLKLSKIEDLNSELTTVTSEVAVQKTVLENCRHDLGSANEQIKQLEILEKEMSVTRKKLIEENNSLILERNSAYEKIDILNQNLQKKCSEVADLEMNANNLIDKLDRLDKELTAKDAQIQNLEEVSKENESLEGELCSLRSTMEILSSELQSVSANLSALSLKAADQNSELENCRQELESRTEQIKLLEMENKDLATTHETLLEEKNNVILERNLGHEEIDSLQQKLQEKNSMVVGLEASMENLEGKLADVVQELNTRNACIETLEFCKTEMDTNFVALNKEKSNLEMEVTTCRTNLKNANLKAERAEAEIQVFKEDVKLLRNDVSKLDGKLVSVQEQRLKEQRELKALIKQQTEDIEFLQNDSKEMCKKLSDSVQELNTRNACIETLELCKTEMDTNLVALYKEKTNLEMEVTSCRTMMEKISTDLQNKSSELSTLESVVNDRIKDLENCQKELESKCERIKLLEAQDLELALKHTSLVEDNNKLVLEKISFIDTIDQLTNSMQDKHTELTSLDSRVKNLEERLESSQQESSDKNERIQVLEKHNLEMDKKYDTLVTEKESLSSDYASLEERFERLSQDFLTKCTEMGSLQDGATILKEEVNRCNKEVEAKSLRIDQLMAMNVEITAKYEGLVKEKVALVAETNSSREKLKRLGHFESQNTLRQQHHDGMLRKNMELTTENGDLKIELQQLKMKLDRQNDFFAKQKECTEQITIMQAQIQDAEKRHHDIIRTLKEEKQNMEAKYEKAKSLIEDLSGQLNAKDKELEKFNSQLENYREHYQASRESLTKVMSLHKSAEHERILLQDRLSKELEKSAQQAAKIEKLMLLLNQHSERSRHRHSLSSDTFVRPQQIEQKPQGNPRRPSITVTYNSAESYQLMIDDDLKNSSLSINAAPQDIKLDNGFAHPRAIVPSGASNYFPCEDEEGELLNFSYLNDQNADQKEMHSKNVFVQPPFSLTSTSRLTEDPDAAFSNFSYLNDLKNGRCELPNESDRLGELQRRNTLCLPHLKTSYPVEMQSQTMLNYRDEDLKTGKLDLTGLSQISTIHGDQMHDLSNDAFGAKRKITKPIQPTYQKPGPPTPGKSSKSGAGQDKAGKTPSSLKRLLRRPHFRTPKGVPKARVTPKKNRENQPPEQNQGPRPRRNLAFTIGLSPKVKSHPKSLAMSKKTSTPKK